MFCIRLLSVSCGRNVTGGFIASFVYQLTEQLVSCSGITVE